MTESAMGLRGKAAIVGYAEWPSRREWPGAPIFALEQWARLAREAVLDAGLAPRDVDGLCVNHVGEADIFVPATVAEYLGLAVNFAERLDLGGASGVGMIWRAAAAIELGLCQAVLCGLPSAPTPPPPTPAPVDPASYFGQASPKWGSPQAEFELPYGNVAQNAGFALIAQRYAASYGWEARAIAKIPAQQRRSANRNPLAVFRDAPITVDDVLASRVIADPLRLLEIVMPTTGGAAVLVASEALARRCRHRPVWIAGCGEHLSAKTPVSMRDLLATPIGPASSRAFAMAGLAPRDMDLVSIYDCYTITVLLTLEDEGFCAKGEAQNFVASHDLAFDGDFPCNTHGGQLGFGQPGLAGGMSHPIEAARQIMGRAEGRQVKRANHAYVSGTGGVMSEQGALVLRGD
jgi:acetyl-CoA acetyltransferase